MSWFAASKTSEVNSALNEWRWTALDIAVDRLHEQRAISVEHFGHLARIDADTLFSFELGFLWGLFSQLVRLCPARVDPEKETQSMMRLFFVYRGFDDKAAQKVADGAARERRSNSKAFANLIAMGEGAVANPPGINRAMLAYLQLASLGQTE